tara:strand:+ start:885 stop:1088 length:204 start_codon:yes stop_codon:yes gene_type:complete
MEREISLEGMTVEKEVLTGLKILIPANIVVTLTAYKFREEIPEIVDGMVRYIVEANNYVDKLLDHVF